MKKTAQPNVTLSLPYPSLLRRLGAWLYDTLIVAAILMLAGGIFIAVIATLLHFNILQLSQYEDVSAYITLHPTVSLIYTAYLGMVIIGFYAYFWTYAGQTLGMRAWKLKLQNKDGSPLKLSQSFVRIATSAFGLGNFLAFTSKRRALQDVMADCEMVVTPKVR